MANAFFKIELPQNEPVKSYAPGSTEKKALKAELAKQAGETIEIPLYIGGKEIKTGRTVDIVSPHDHQKVLAKCHQAGEAEIQLALAAAEKGRKEWASLPWHDRAAVFLKAADLLATTWRDRMNAATMLGQSKTVHQAEIDAACELIDFFKFNCYYMTKIYQEQPSSQPFMWNRSQARGLEGFVYAITPFNFTSIGINLAAAPALMGCAVMWKPAMTSMRAAWVGMQILHEAGLPAGVINMIPGDAKEISNTLLNHPQLAGIHFTGSTQTFNHLWKEVGKNIDRYKAYPRVVGETGGKDFIFAHQSADVDQLVTAMVRGAFEYQGQKCSAASRAYVPQSLWPAVKRKITAMVQEIKVGDVADFTNFMGAVIDKRAYDKITDYIKFAASASDAEIIAGGEFDDKTGYFIKPTVIETSNPKFKTMVEEIFGPVLTIYPYEDDRLEEALELCDTATDYALTGAIFARDRVMIAKLTDRLEQAAGNFYINDKPTGAVVGQQPFGGGRNSGTNDKAGSPYNLLRWVSHRTLKENFIPITDFRYPFMAEK